MIPRAKFPKPDKKRQEQKATHKYPPKPKYEVLRYQNGHRVPRYKNLSDWLADHGWRS